MCGLPVKLPTPAIRRPPCWGRRTRFVPSFEYLFIKSQSRYKRFYVSFSSSFSYGPVSFRDSMQCINGTLQNKQPAIHNEACNQTCNFRVKNVVNAYVTYEQTLHHVSTRKCNSILLLTETEHISLVPMISTTGTYRHGL
jgi:hypothetical protein